jgi:hypothetical protein
VVVLDDLVFSVTDDLDDRWQCAYGDTTLIPSWRFGAAAAAAVSTRTLVEVWRDGRGLRQELVDLKAVSETVEFEAPAGVGTRMMFTVDVEFVGAGSVITHELDGLEFHGPDCGLGTAGVELVDRRLLD